MSKRNRVSPEGETVDGQAEPVVSGTRAKSIRNVILTDLVNGVDKQVTMAKIVEAFPESAAAKKFKAHYAWYKGYLKKNPAERAKFQTAAAE